MPAKMMADSQCSRFDFTFPKFHSDGFEFTDSIIREHLGDHCTKWVFQEEKSDEGYEHFQGRCTLIKKRHVKEAGALCNSTLPQTGVHLSVTSNPVYKTGDFSYAMKGDTRVAGPWKDIDKKAPVKGGGLLAPQARHRVQGHG